MKIEQRETFTPVVITLETLEEVRVLQGVVAKVGGTEANDLMNKLYTSLDTVTDGDYTRYKRNPFTGGGLVPDRGGED